MSRYQVVKKSFIDGRLLYPGEEVEYSGVAGGNLKLISQAKETPNTMLVPVDMLALEPVIIETDAKPILLSHEQDTGNGAGVDAELALLRDEYLQLFGKKAHHMAGADKLRSEIDIKRKELGV